jgi:2-octaprenyl-6-methoxyphenol hydroxylase
MSQSLDVAVCILGAGPVGATLAARLAAAGIPTAIVDAAPLPRMEVPAFDGRAYAIAAGSRDLLEAAGIWDRLPTEPNPIRHIRVADGRPGEPASRLKLDFSADDTGVPAFGWMLEARALRVALNARLPHLPNLSVFAPARATAERDEAGVRVTLSDGTTISARLLVGAEGRASPSRRAAGIPELHHDYGQLGLVGAVAHEHPHHDRALELFLPNGPFAQLPMRGTPEYPNLSAIVWSETRAIGEAALRLPDAAYGREIARRMGGHLGRVTPVGQRWSYPLSALHVARYVDTRLALVGDAAHGIHPIAGQGLNLGFRDAAALAGAVIGTADPGAAEVLARYQRDRRPDGLLMLGATHGLEALFGNDVGPIRLARRLGIAAVDRLPRLRRFFARRAMGLASA